MPGSMIREVMTELGTVIAMGTTEANLSHPISAFFFT